eukprot:COSAG06_NODE_67_length_26084_cov_784.027670_23_plen_210_part_00
MLARSPPPPRLTRVYPAWAAQWYNSLKVIVLPAAQVGGGEETGAVPPPAPTPTAADDDDDAWPAAPLPLGDDEFPDDILAVVCSFLALRELGRLACVARRFTEPTLTEPGGGGGGAGGAQLLSPIEEGARLRLAAGGGGGGGGASAVERLVGETWVRALWRVQYCLKFTSCGPEVVLSEEGALRLRAVAAVWLSVPVSAFYLCLSLRFS